QQLVVDRGRCLVHEVRAVEQRPHAVTLRLAQRPRLRLAPAAAAAAASVTDGGAGSGWPAAGRSPYTPPACRSTAPTRRSPHRSWCGLAPAARAVGRELTQQRGELSLHLD